ncbi:MAG: hypothetical protein MSC31_14520 [Solirubrobacteraceae bacterium MAG38_C4-C5]|nr:hypothetical protein [Candidatus Siliceabacter maunaloa]
MSTRQRVGLVTLAVTVLAVAFVALRPADDDERPASAATPAPTSPTATPDTDTPTEPPTATEPAQPSAPLLTADGTPRSIEVIQGEDVRFRVRSSEGERLHVHGYDIFRELAPEKTVELSFPAELEGIFEIELERSGTLLAELEVYP